MRAVYWKELRELALVGIPLAIGAAFTGWEYSSHAGEMDELLWLMLLGGFAVGLAHGVLDRHRRGDLFLRHRPLPRWRLEAARTLAGATVLVFLVGVALAFLVWGAAHHARLLERFRAPDALRHYLREPREVTAGFGAYVLLLGAAVWAATRWICSAPRAWHVALLFVVAPFLLARPVATVEGIPGAIALMAVIAACCTWQVVAKKRALVTLFLTGWLVLGGSASLRAAAQGLLFEVYPTYGVTDDGEVQSWKIWGRRLDFYDLERNVLSSGAEIPSLGTLAFQPHAPTSSFDWLDQLPPYFEVRTPYWARETARWLNQAQVRLPNGDIRAPAQLFWKFEDGRFICRQRFPDKVLAGFGPEGFVAGPGATAGRSFEGVVDFRGHPEHWASYLGDSRGSFVLTIEDQPDRRFEDPIRVAVVRRAQRVLSSTGRLRSAADLVQREDQLALVRGEETLASVAWDGDKEEILRSRAIWLDREQEARATVVSLVRPPHPASATYRARFLRPGQAALVNDILVQPETLLERSIAGVGGVVALARPLPLVVASYLADAPADFESMASWWWLDPWFGGRRMTAWLVAALLLTALLGWWARQQALRRCATMREVHFWTAVAVLLGPLGVIWMRLTVPWTVVEPVGDGVRAVNRDATPENDAAWPEPATVGTEVFAR